MGGGGTKSDEGFSRSGAYLYDISALNLYTNSIFNEAVLYIETSFQIDPEVIHGGP